MTEDKEPDRRAELARPDEAMLREIERSQQFLRDHEWAIRQAREAQRFYKEHESVIRQVQQLWPLVLQSQAMRRQIDPIIKLVEQLTRGGVWPVPPLQQRLMRTVEAALRDIQPPQVVAVGHPVTVDISVPIPTAIVFSGSAALPPRRASGQMKVQAPDSIERNIGRIFVLVLVAIGTAGLLGVQGPDRVTVDHWLTVLSFALAIAVLVWNALNKQK
jgi:hypothetical protein